MRKASINEYLFFFNTILFINISVSFYYCFILNNDIGTLYTSNSSIFCIFLASQVCFVVPLLISYKANKKVKLVLGLPILLSFFLLIYSDGRAGWIGCIVGLGYVGFSFIKYLKYKKIFLLAIIPTTLIFVAILYFYKSASTNGRLLIYKVSATMLHNNWLFGIGHGQFKVKYNVTQAKYFSTHSIDSAEALLAGDTIFAFNDFYQCIIEYGFIGLVFLILFFYFLYKHIKNVVVTKNNKALFTSATASLICILVAASFSYPLQILPIILQGVLCLAITCSYPQTSSFMFSIPKPVSIGLKFLFVNLIILLGIHYFNLYHFKLKSEDALVLSRSGFKNQSLKLYDTLSKSYIKNGDVNYLYAEQLYYANKLNEAKTEITKTFLLNNSHLVYSLAANIENELKNYPQAEQYYKTAIYMVPNRMVSRKNLLDFYVQQKDTPNAIFWANSILNMPIKVPSTTTENIKNTTQKIYNAFTLTKK